MGVYIPGMEMPTSCFECKLLDYTDTFKCRYRFESLAREHGINISRPDWCPLVPVPEHGRLIDADALHEELYALEYARENEWLDGVREARGVDAARVALLVAPTIIPADA